MPHPVRQRYRIQGEAIDKRIWANTVDRAGACDILQRHAVAESTLSDEDETLGQCHGRQDGAAVEAPLVDGVDTYGNDDRGERSVALETGTADGRQGGGETDALQGTAIGESELTQRRQPLGQYNLGEARAGERHSSNGGQAFRERHRLQAIATEESIIVNCVQCRGQCYRLHGGAFVEGSIADSGDTLGNNGRCERRAAEEAVSVNGAEGGGHRDAGDVIAFEESAITHFGHRVVAATVGHRVRNHDSTLRFGISGPHLIVHRVDVGVQRRHQGGVTGAVDDVIQRCTLVGMAENSVLGFHALPSEQCHRQDGQN